MVEDLEADSVSEGILDTAKIIHEETDAILKYISGTKGKLISLEENIPSPVADNFDLRKLSRPGDYDLPTHFMIGSDTSNITGEAKPLKDSLIRYCETMLKLVPNQNLYALHNLNPLTHKIFPDENYRLYKSWECSFFYHKSVIQTLSNLTNLQGEIMRVETAAFEQLKKSSENK